MVSTAGAMAVRLEVAPDTRPRVFHWSTVAEDLTGHGHIARGLGEGERYIFAVPLAEA